MADESYYPDTDSDSDPGAGPEEGNESEKNDRPTQLLSKSFLGDLKPGDKITLEIVHGYEDEYEVAKVKKKDDSGESEDMRSAMGKLDEMAT
jgi:hypothetical protein